MFILFFFFFLRGAFFSPYMVTVNCLSRPCSESFCFVRSSHMSVFCPHISTCVCLFPALVSCWRPGEHTHTRKLHSDTLCSRSSSFFRYLATSHFLSFPGSFSGPRRRLFLPTLPRSLLPVFTPPPLSFQSHSSQPSHCILDERHSSFFFSLSLLPTADWLYCDSGILLPQIRKLSREYRRVPLGRDV